MPENTPRRLMRFYRKNEQPPAQNESQNNQSNNQGNNANAEEDYKEPFAPNGRPLLAEIPSMDYEDMEKNKGNYEEIHKIEQKNMEEKLALDEVDKFKKTHNRMPTNEETGRIAETLFTQLKNIDADALYPELSKSQNAGQNVSTRRGRRGENPVIIEKGLNLKNTPAQTPLTTRANSPQGGQEVNDIKSLLEEESISGKGKKKGEDEFDLGLDSDIEEDSKIEDSEEDISQLELNENECPNCKKTTDKIVYCPKCGTAFCKNCAKLDGTQLICPKCGTKTKA